MDIWMLAVLAVWLPVALGLALLVGRSVADAERRERRRPGLHPDRSGHPVPVARLAPVPRQGQPGRSPQAERHLAS